MQMPIIASQPRREFEWKLDNATGLPVAPVTILGRGRWILCCPLCSCVHEIRGKVDSTVYTPRCLLREFAAQSQRHMGANWKNIYGQWLQLHPLAATFNSVALAETVALPLPPSRIEMGKRKLELEAAA